MTGAEKLRMLAKIAAEIELMVAEADAQKAA